MSRRATVERNTSETQIRVSLELDGTGENTISTGIGFLDHMLSAFSRHGHFDLELTCRGDLHIDSHHSVEDCAITLGQAFGKALGDKAGVTRFGHSFVPMDETLVRATIDLSGRPFAVWKVPSLREKVGDLPVDLAAHFWASFAEHSRTTLHIECLYGTNQHHVFEGVWKACGRALADAVAMSGRGDAVPSTKGTLTEGDA